jgi:hypothetical protein
VNSATGKVVKKAKAVGQALADSLKELAQQLRETGYGE